MNFVKILLTILFSLSGYTEAAGTLKKQMAECITHQSRAVTLFDYQSNPIISATKPNIQSNFSDRRNIHYIVDAAQQNQKTKYRTGSKRYKNRTQRIYRKNPMQKWLLLAKQEAKSDAQASLYVSFPQELLVQRHKNLCVISPRA